MPTQEITTTEYECNRCSYKWITRKNGIEKDGLPKHCPKCKTWMWNNERKYLSPIKYPEKDPSGALTAAVLLKRQWERQRRRDQRKSR